MLVQKYAGIATGDNNERGNNDGCAHPILLGAMRLSVYLLTVLGKVVV